MNKQNKIHIINKRKGLSIPATIVVFDIDRSSVLGNPYSMQDESQRDSVCDQYEAYFQNIINSAENEYLDFKRALQDLLTTLKTNSIALSCWCAPRRCHGETIKRYLEAQIKEE